MEDSRTPRYRPPHLVHPLSPNSQKAHGDNGSKPAYWRDSRRANGPLPTNWIQARDEATLNIRRHSNTQMTTAVVKISPPTSARVFPNVQNHDNLPIEAICAGGDVVLTLKRLNPTNNSISPLLRARVSSAVMSKASVALTKGFALAGGVMKSISMGPDISASRRGQDVNLVFSSTGSVTALQENVRLLLRVLHSPTDDWEPLSGWTVGNLLEVAWSLDCQRGLVPWIEVYLSWPSDLDDARPAERLFVTVILSFVMGDEKAFKRSSLQYIYSHSNVREMEDPCFRKSLGIIALIQSTYRVSLKIPYHSLHISPGLALCLTLIAMADDVEKRKRRYIRQLLDIIEITTIYPKNHRPDMDTPLAHIIAMGALSICVPHYFGKLVALHQLSWSYSVNGLLAVFDEIEQFMTTSWMRAQHPWFMVLEGIGPGQAFGDKTRELRAKMDGLDLNQYILNMEQFMEVDRFYIDKEGLCKVA